VIKVWADTETKSEVDLRAAGTHRYTEDPSTKIQLFSFAFDDGPVNLWVPEEGEPMPKDLKEAYRDPECIFHFHNAFFDRLVIEHDLKIVLPIQRYRCVMAQALSHGLPGALDKLGEAVGLPEDKRKHAAGKRLVQLFCNPKKQKDGTLKWATPETHPEQWAQYKEYCKQDTASMRDVAKRIPRWNYPGQQTELELWYIDQICNSRGMAIDLELVDAAMAAIAKEQANLARKTRTMTNEEVQAASQRDALLRFITAQYGFQLDNMQKATIEKIVADEEYPADMRELLQVRLDTCTTSTAKYKKMKAVASSDNRIRGTVQFAGATRTLRDCIAKGTLVLVLTSEGNIEEKPIEFVEVSDMVWDGEDWVAHEGVEYRGEKDVIEWDGICATADHEVYLSETESVPLEIAMKLNLKLWRVNVYADKSIA
jgi:DNA polymerase